MPSRRSSPPPRSTRCREDHVGLRCSATRSSPSRRNGASTSSGPSPGIRSDDRSSTSQRSGTTFGALPPVMSAAFTVGAPTSGCTRVGEHLRRGEAGTATSPGSRSRRGAVGAVGGFPVRDRGDPRAAALGERDLHLGRLAHDRRVLIQEPCSRRTLVPWIPASSSSATRWSSSVPAERDARLGGSPRRPRAPPRSVPSCRTPRVRSSRPRPPRPRRAARPGQGSPAGTVSRCPFQASRGRPPEPSRRDDARTLLLGSDDPGLGSEVR